MWRIFGSEEGIAGEWILLICLFIVNYVLIFLSKFVGKKGENLATKQDIGKITDKIESVKQEYAQKLERTRTELSAQLKTSSYRYEQEYKILERLYELLVEVHESAMGLRPDLESEEALQDKELKTKRLRRSYDAIYSLYRFAEEKRPFYPDKIYDAIQSMRNIASLEAAQFRIRDPENNLIKYWEDADTNKEEIKQSSNTAMKLIRQRVTEWENLTN